ncbi:MAG: hypothetical protein AAFP17_13365 [Pseudomonadota bacterium]
MQIVRVALVFVAAALIATQFFSLVASGGTGRAEAAPPASSTSTGAWPTLALTLAADLPLGVVYFDGAATRGDATTGALETPAEVRHAGLIYR